MNVSNQSVYLFGCELLPLDAMTCEQYLAWLLSEHDASVLGDVGSLIWVLTHCHDGVTWGRYDITQKSWLLGNAIAPDISPPILRKSILELRIFGEVGEILIWRTDTGLQGRVLRESASAPQSNDSAYPLRPVDESRILLGTHVLKQYVEGFTHVSDGTAKEQVLPLIVTDNHLRFGNARLVIRNYYEADNMTGVVRIAATRLVKLTVEMGR